MKTAIDSNVLSAIWSGEPMAEKAVERLGTARDEGALLISPFVFAELLAYPGATEAKLREFLDDTDIVIDEKLHSQIWVEAGLRLARYAHRRRLSLGVGPRRLLTDYLIGAHALIQTDRLLTFDSNVYQQDFPELRLH
ncbi:MAG: type II toxin-antitoxin system VapC family toxin [Terracidiphilus sp.]